MYSYRNPPEPTSLQPNLRICQLQGCFQLGRVFSLLAQHGLDVANRAVGVSKSPRHMAVIVSTRTDFLTTGYARVSEPAI